MKVEANTPCFVCGSRQSHLLMETYFPGFAYPGVFCMRQCDGCGLMFNSPRLPDQDIRALYGENYYFFQRTDAREFQRILDVYNRTIAQLEDRVVDKRVLEIGSAKGYLLAVMKRLGWEVQGIEVSPVAARYAKKRFNITSFEGSLEEYVATCNGARFPLVLAIDVIEHVPAPDTFVACLKEIVSPGGLLVIDTPNAESHNISVEGSDWKGFNPFHIFLFSSHALTKLLQSSGFVVEKVFSYGNQPATVHFDSNAVSVVSLPVGPARSLKATAKKVLKRAHLLDALVELHGWANRKRAAICGTDLRRTVCKIQEGPHYFQTADSNGPLSAGSKGDNLVVIARRKQL